MKTENEICLLKGFEGQFGKLKEQPLLSSLPPCLVNIQVVGTLGTLEFYSTSKHRGATVFPGCAERGN